MSTAPSVRTAAPVNTCPSVRALLHRGLLLLALAALTWSGCSENETEDFGPVLAGRCEHNLTEAVCPRCTPALEAVYRAQGNWCEQHDFPESLCPICNPGAALPGAAEATTSDHGADWCGGHGLPESMCTKCNPSLVPRFRAAGDYCETHGFPESACPICNADENTPENEEALGEEASGEETPHELSDPSVRALENRVIRLASLETEARVGIDWIAAEVAPEAAAQTEVRCAARIAFDADRLADIRAVLPGIVRGIDVELGSTVEAGAPLFELQSVRIGEIQGELLSARQRIRTAEANLERQRQLRSEAISSARQLELAQQELAAARAQARTAQATLRLAGAAAASPSGRSRLRAPIGGTIVERPATLGLLATPEQSLATIADTSTMWALCDVPESAADALMLGQRLRLDLPGSPEGNVTWIAAQVDPQRRTVAVRAELPNPDGRLRANQFAEATIAGAPSERAFSLPRASVQRAEGREVVFVRTAAATFEPRVVERHGDGDPVLVTGRIAAGDAIVTTGAPLLRTEILPGSIGAGCCEVE